MKPARRSRLAATSTALLVLSALVLLHGAAFPVLGHSRFVLTPIYAERGRAFTAAVPTDRWSAQLGPSIAVVEENGVALGPGDAMHDSVRGQGGGAFCFWGSSVYFSSSDNSDARSNGREYVARGPRVLPSAVPGIASFAFTLALFWLVTLTIGWRGLVTAGRRLLTISDGPPLSPGRLAVGLAIVGLVFAIVRAPFYLHYRLPHFAIDYASYYGPYEQMRTGHWPHFDWRTPGFPLLIALVLSTTHRVFALVVVNSLASLAAAMLLARSLMRAYPRTWLLSALGVAAGISSPLAFNLETGLVNDSLYCSCLMACLAFAIEALRFEKRRAFALASTAMAVAILIRPAGMFLLVLYLVLLAFLRWNGKLRRFLAAFAIPLPAILGLLCCYNRATLGLFTISPFGAWNLIGAVGTFLDESPSYAEEVNAFVRKTAESVTPTEREQIATTWNPDVLIEDFERHYAPTFHVAVRLPGSFLERTQLLKQLSRDAIRHHPKLYAKFVVANLYHFFITNQRAAEQDPLDPNEVTLRYGRLFGPTDYNSNLTESQKEAILREYYRASPPASGFERKGSLVVPEQTASLAIYRAFRALRQPLCHNGLWSCLFGLMLVASTALLAASRFHDRDALVVFLATATVCGAGLVVSLVEMSLDRYSYATEFIYYLLPAFVPVLTASGTRLRSARGTDTA